MALPIKFQPDSQGAPTLRATLDMADVLREVADGFSSQVDEHLRRMFEFLHKQAVHAKSEDDPHFDRQAQAHALYWLQRILAGLRPLPAMGDDAFPIATSLQTGSVGSNGNLRLILDNAIAIELPHKWLHGPVGLAAFITKNCRPEKGPRPKRPSGPWCLQCDRPPSAGCQGDAEGNGAHDIIGSVPYDGLGD